MPEQFELHQDGIETSPLLSKIQRMPEFELHQDGIETTSKANRTGQLKRLNCTKMGLKHIMYARTKTIKLSLNCTKMGLKLNIVMKFFLPYQFELHQDGIYRPIYARYYGILSTHQLQPVYS
ncbi:MAG: hypothetical protein DWQ10_12345 [Calditrichaeota bacterium]|nr:MAG: hypothetical protein DWQ10_12345 [Calditrichota bacterium]